MPGTGLVGRTEDLARARRALADDPTSVVTVSGPAGIGKSRLVAEVRTSLLADGWFVVALTGTAASSALPLGVWSAWIPSEPSATMPLASRVASAIREAAGGARVVVIVDDVNLLDDASAALLHQLSLSERFGVLLVSRRPPLGGEPLEALWSVPQAVALVLAPLSEAELEALVARVVGHPLTKACAADIAVLAHGNALYAREIGLAALDAGSVAVDASGHATIALPSARSRLSDLLSRRMEGLAADQRAVMVQLALGEPLGPGELDATPECLMALEAAGLVQSSLDERRLVLQLVHPLYGEVLRRETSPLQRRDALRRLVGALAATGVRRRNDDTRLAAWSLEAGCPVAPAVLASAAQTARASTDLDLAERLAEALVEAAPGFVSGCILAEVLYDVGDIERLDAHTSAWQQHAASPDELAVFSIHRAMAAYWHRGDPVTAMEHLQRAADVASDRAIRFEAEGVAASFDAMSARPHAALARATPLLDVASGRALGHAAAAAAHAYQTLGRPITALAVIDTAATTLRGGRTDRAMGADHMLDVARLAVLAQAGSVAAAEAALADTSAWAPLADHGSLVFAEALIRLLQGRFREAAIAYERADALVRRGRFHGNRRTVLCGQALAWAQLGDKERSATALAELERLGPHPWRVFDSYVWQARAWVAQVSGDPHAARDLLAEGAAECRAVGDVEGELGCLYQLARVGDAAGAAPAVAALAADLEGELLPAMIDHVLASADGDVARLEAAGERLARCGTVLWAAEALAEASELAARAGDARRAAASARRSAGLRDQCEATVTPRLAGTGALVPLTRREREIVVLASQGLTSRVIGERLFVSARTVESHLARAYSKLGVGTRAELARALSGTLYGTD